MWKAVSESPSTPERCPQERGCLGWVKTGNTNKGEEHRTEEEVRGAIRRLYVRHLFEELRNNLRIIYRRGLIFNNYSEGGSDSL